MSYLKNILVIENDALTLEAIKKALYETIYVDDEITLNIIIIRNYEDALIKIDKPHSKMIIDMVFLNINMGLHHTNRPVFCEDLAAKIRQLYTNTKLVLFGSHCDNYRINTMLSTLNPEGFFIKSDVDHKGLKKAILTIQNNIPYYSKTVLHFMKRHFFNGMAIDKTDRQLLYFLSKGVKTAHLPNYVCLSDGAVQRRKRRLKELLNVEGRNDMLLLKLAEEKGFI